MGFIIHDRKALVSMGGDDSDDMLSIQEALSDLERNGFMLHSVVPQHQIWPEGGSPMPVKTGPYFIFHNGEPQRRPRPLSGQG